MTSSMLAGERRWASARRGGMTVLGKVAVPKPINLPSQKLENHGLDPNVEIVPKGSLSWGSRPSSSTSNPWGSSSASPNADGATNSPHHPSGRPSSGGGLSRPSTAGSDRHEPSTTTWGPNSRPSSASGVLTSNQSSLTNSRPLSAETRPGSSHLSRFAEPAYDYNNNINNNNNPVAWGPNGTADKLSIPSKANNFSLSSGDFPTLGSEKDNTGKNSEPHDHGSQVRPGSSSGRTIQSDHKSGTVDTWTREGSPYYEDGPHPPADRWQQGDPHQYMNPNGPPQHYDTWRGPPMNGPPPAGVWYRGPPPPPPAGPPYPPVPHGGYPMEPFPYYHHPQIPPNLANSQSGPPPGPGPRGHHPRNGDFYRPQMPDPFMRPGMPMRPGFYPGPGPYDGYYGPPMGYNPNERDMQFMGMPPGPHGPPPGPPGSHGPPPGPPGPHGPPHGPPVYNMGPPQNHPELHDPHFRGTGRGPVGNMYVPEQVDSIPPEEHRGPYKVLRKRENEREDNWEEDNWEQNVEKNDQTRGSFHKNERVTDTRRNENKSQFPEASHDIPSNQKDPSLMEKIEGLNAKARASDVRENPEQKNRLLINPNENPTIAFGTISDAGNVSSFSRQPHHGVRNRAEHHNKGRLNNQDNDGWRKKPQILGSDGGQVVSNTVSVEAAENSETSNTDESDGQAQRARMRELAKQRAMQLQKEEEERIKEQKAKALAKLEELNRRTLATADGTTQTTEKIVTSVPEQENVEGFQKQSGPVIDDSKCEPVDAKVAQVNEKSQQEPVDQTTVTKQSVANANDASVGNDGGPHRQKHVNHRQKQSVQTVESSVDKSTTSGSGAVTKNPLSTVTVAGESVPNQENSLNITSEPTQLKKRNNKSSKNKHKIDDSRETDVAIPQNDLNLDNKPQHSRRMPRNPQANNRTGDRFHVGDVAVWAPVRFLNKEEEISQDDVALPAKSIQTNLKNKRAEMERYVPKPVAQQQSSSPEKVVFEDVTAVTHVGPTVDLNNSKQNKPVKTYKNEAPAPNPVITETNVTTHEWDPSDGWFMPDELPPVEVTAVTFVKDEGGPTGKGKKPAYKNQKSSTMKNQNYDQIGSEVEIQVQQTDNRPASRENRSSHWQPKPQGYRGVGGGGQTASSEVKRVPYDGQQEIRRERRPNSYRQQRPQSPLEDEAAMFDQQHGHGQPTGFRKYGGQHNRPVGQDDRRKHNPNANRERRQNLHYEYQPVGSNNNSSYKSGNLDAPADASGNADPRYKERGSASGQSQGQGQPRRGGGNFYGRQ